MTKGKDQSEASYHQPLSFSVLIFELYAKKIGLSHITVIWVLNNCESHIVVTLSDNNNNMSKLLQGIVLVVFILFMW